MKRRKETAVKTQETRNYLSERHQIRDNAGKKWLTGMKELVLTENRNQS